MAKKNTSVAKRHRQSLKARARNRANKSRVKTAIRNLMEMTGKEEALKALPKTVAVIDKVAAKGSIKKNKASRLKSRLMLHVNALSA